MIKQILIGAIAAALLAPLTSFAKSVKTLSVDESEVAQVRVSLGYSTLLQFDSRPVQAIVGDQDSFKVEYVGNSIAIKPLMSGVSTNLFVITEYGKFNFRISSGRGFEPDYILKIKRKSSAVTDASSGIMTKSVGTSRTVGGITLRLISVASAKVNAPMIYSFELYSKDKRINFQPGDFEILQSGRSLPIENIYIERLSIDKGQRLFGMVHVKREHLRSGYKSMLQFKPGTIKGGIQISAPSI